MKICQHNHTCMAENNALLKINFILAIIVKNKYRDQRVSMQEKTPKKATIR